MPKSIPLINQLMAAAEEERQRAERKVERLLKDRQQLEGPKQSASSYELQDNRTETDFQRLLIKQYSRLIKELEARGKATDLVGVGSLVTLKYVDDDSEEKIVVTKEKDGNLSGVNLVSTGSPLGKVLVGKQRGETVELQLSSGITGIQITEVG